MYEPSQRRVIDFYAELVKPIMDRQGQVDGPIQLEGLGGDGFDRLELTRYWNNTYGSNISDRPRALQSPEAGNVWVLIPWGSLVTRLLKHATGEQIWQPFPDAQPVLPTLGRRAGTILLDFLPLEYAPGAPDLFLRTAPVIPHSLVVTDPVAVYSGQCIRGPGQRNRIGANRYPESLFFYRHLLFFRPRLEAKENVLFRLELEPGEEHCTRVRFVGLDVAQGPVLDRRDIEGVFGIPGTASLPAVAFEMFGGRMSSVEWCRVEGIQVGVRMAGSLPQNWIESCDLRCPIPVDIAQSEDTTLWVTHFAGEGPSYLGGTNTQTWFGAIEPTIPERGRDAHEVVLSGLGSGIFASHTEGRLAPVPPRIIPQGQHRAGIRIRAQSTFCHVSESFVSQEGFPILLERDVAAALIRLPTGQPSAIQPTLDLGLTNLLRNTTFEGAEQKNPGEGWISRRLGTFERVPAGRGFYASLTMQTNPPKPGRAGVSAKVLRQGVSPDTTSWIYSTADRTYAAGCWIRTTGAASIHLRLEEYFKGPGPEFRSSVSNRCRGTGDWEHLTVMLHTSERARLIEFALVTTAGVRFEISEPMLVEGAWLPPFHPHLMSDGGGRLDGELLPQASAEEMNTSLVGPLPETAEVSFGRTGTPAYIKGLVVALGQAPIGQKLSVRLVIDAEEDLQSFPEDRWFEIQVSQTPFRTRLDLPALAVSAGAGIRLQVMTGKQAGKNLRDLAACLLLTRGV